MSLPRPPLSHHSGTLSSLTNENAAVGRFRPSYAPFPAPGKSSNRGMNRQSALIFADFNNFESPRASRQNYNGRESDDEDFSSGPNLDVKSEDYSVEKNLPEPPYHIFTLAKKKQMVYIVSLAGLFSPLSSNIYFPALGQISKVYFLAAL
jgi:hypothetical protein